MRYLYDRAIQQQHNWIIIITCPNYVSVNISSLSHLVSHEMGQRLDAKRIIKQVFASMRSVEAAMFPLLTVLRLCGFGIFEYPCGRLRLYPSILYILTILLFYVYISIEANLFLKRFDIAIFPMFKFSTIFVIVAMLFSLCYNKVRHLMLWVSRNDSWYWFSFW